MAEKLSVVSLTTSDEQKRNLAALVGAIIPATDTPEATAHGVDQFGLTMAGDCFENEKQQAFFAGLNKVETAEDTLRGKSFSQISEAERLEILQQLNGHLLPLKIVEPLYSNENSGGYRKIK